MGKGIGLSEMTPCSSKYVKYSRNATIVRFRDAGAMLWSIRRRSQHPQLSDEFGVRNRHHILGVKHTWMEPPGRDGHFKAGPSRTGGMGNHGDQRPILIQRRNTQDQARPDFDCQTEIH